jgi:hypothetical protein
MTNKNHLHMDSQEQHWHFAYSEESVTWSGVVYCQIPQGSNTTALLREFHGLDCRVVAMINHQDFYDALELSPTNQEKESLRLKV